MAFHYRKLLDESDIDKSCSSFCDPDENPDAICSFDCINLCHTVCHAPPPPLPFPTPSTVVSDTAEPHKTHKLSLVLTVSLAVLATAFLLFTCYTVYKFYSIWYKSRRRRVEQTGQDRDPGSDEFLDEDQQRAMVDHHVWYIRTVGLHPSVISAITVVKYKKGDGMIEGSDCSVCLSEFRDDETLRLLPKCNHAFHIPCIDTWLRSHTNCPLCRAGIVKNTPEEVTVNDSGVEEAGIESSESNRASEIRIGVEDDNETQSVSVDPLSATAIHSAMADAFPGRNSDDQLVRGKE